MAINWRNVGFNDPNSGDGQPGNLVRQGTGAQEGLGGLLSTLGNAATVTNDTIKGIGESRLREQLSGVQSQADLDAFQRSSGSIFDPSNARANQIIQERGSQIGQAAQGARDRRISEQADTYAANLTSINNTVTAGQGVGKSLEDQTNSLFQANAFKNLTAEDKAKAQDNIQADFIDRSGLDTTQNAIAKQSSSEDQLVLSEVNRNFDDAEREIFNSSGIPEDVWNLFKQEGEPISVGDAVQEVSGQGIDESQFAGELEQEANKFFKKTLGRNITGAELSHLLRTTGATENFELFSDNFKEFNGGSFEVRARELVAQLKRAKDNSSFINKSITSLTRGRKKATDEVSSKAASFLKNLGANSRARKRGETVEFLTANPLDATQFVARHSASAEKVLRDVFNKVNPKGDKTKAVKKGSKLNFSTPIDGTGLIDVDQLDTSRTEAELRRRATSGFGI